MPKPSHRDKLLHEGLKVLLSHGYAGASVRDVVRAAGVPQGSFTNHFESKEAFAQEVLELYFSLVQANIDKTLENESLSPLRRLRAWFDVQISFLQSVDFRTGCLIGNFCVECSEQSEPMRLRLAEIIDMINAATVHCLRAAAKAGEIPTSIDALEMASFLNASWQGAILQSKVEQSVKPLDRFKKVVFGRMLGIERKLERTASQPTRLRKR